MQNPIKTSPVQNRKSFSKSSRDRRQVAVNPERKRDEDRYSFQKQAGE